MTRKPRKILKPAFYNAALSELRKHFAGMPVGRLRSAAQDVHTAMVRLIYRGVVEGAIVSLSPAGTLRVRRGKRRRCFIPVKGKAESVVPVGVRFIPSRMLWEAVRAE